MVCVKKKKILGPPGGSVVKNLPANAGDTGLIRGPGRSHMVQSSWARVLQLSSLCSRAQGSKLVSPHAAAAESQAP